MAALAEGIGGILNMAGAKGLSYTTYISAAWPDAGQPPGPRNLKGTINFSPERSVTTHEGTTIVFEKTEALAHAATEVALRALGEEEAGIARVIVEPFGTMPDYPPTRR